MDSHPVKKTDDYGVLFKTLRQRNKLTQQEFGARLGISHTHVSKIESGKENPSATLIMLLNYEFPEIDTKENGTVGYPHSPAESQRRILEYINILQNVDIDNKSDVKHIYFIEFILADLITCLERTTASSSYRTRLFELIEEFLGYVSHGITILNDSSKLKNGDVKLSQYSSIWCDLRACFDDIIALLDERIKQ